MAKWPSSCQKLSFSNFFLFSCYPWQAQKWNSLQKTFASLLLPDVQCIISWKPQSSIGTYSKVHSTYSYIDFPFTCNNVSMVGPKDWFSLDSPVTPQKLIFCTLASQEIIGTFSLKYLCLRINFLLKGELGPSCEEIELSYSVPNKKEGSVTLDTNVTFCSPLQ